MVDSDATRALPARGSTSLAETPYARAPTATVSSLNSDHSTQQLICKSPQKTPLPPKSKSNSVSVKTKSVDADVSSDKDKDKAGSRRLVVFLGLGQMCLGALLMAAGAGAVVKGAALARVGAGLWAGCFAVVTGVVGVLAGIYDCYGLNGKGGPGNSGLLVAFLALSLICLACGNSAAVLAGTGLHRDYYRASPPAPQSFQEEMDLWTPVLSNISVLILATAHCLLCIISVCHLSKRVCPCFRRKLPYDHNQFDPSFKGQPLPGPYVIQIEDKPPSRERQQGHQLCQDLETRLQATDKGKKEEQQFDSATSRSVLVKSWLGGQTAGSRGGRARGIKGRPRPPPVLLVPAHHATTLGRMPMGVNMMVPPRYATLPLPPPHPPHLYYPVLDTRVRRRRSPRGVRDERRRRAQGRDRDSQLTRSLERIHRKRRAERERERLSEADLKSTYTGLDRAYAEQFIAVCDESRSHANERSDSLTSTVSSDLSATEHSHPC